MSGSVRNSIRLRRRGVFAQGIVLIFAMALLGSVLASCGGDDDNGSTAATADADILRVALWQTVASWDPRTGSGDEPMWFANIYEPLLYANPPGSAEPYTPCLATSWEVSDDGMTWTFRLREGVTFHDGEPFNAEAVKYSVEATHEMGMGSAYIWDPVEQINVVDEYTVEMVCSYPAPLDRVATSMYGAWMFSPATKGKDADWWNMPNEAGTGPYELVSYSPDQETVLERNPDYWGGWHEGQFEKVVMEHVDDVATMRQMLEAGQVDFVSRVSRDAVPAMEDNENVKILVVPGVENFIVQFNTQKPPLDDVEVRQALSYATNYEDILAVATNGYGKIARGPIPSSLYPYDPDTPQYTYDPEKAKQMLADAGYGDGLTLTMTYTSGDAYGPKLAPVLKENFADIGVTLELQALLFDQQMAKARGPAKGRQDMVAYGWWPGYPHGYDNLYPLFHTEANPDKPTWNLSYWSSEEFDRLIDTAYSDEAVEPEQAQELYNEAQTMLVEEAPALYLFDIDSVYGTLPSLKLTDMAVNPNYVNVLCFYQTSK